MPNIYFDVYINASAKAIFEAFTEPHHLDKWWTFKSSGRAELGAIYNLNFTDRYDWYGKVVSLETDKNFYLKMTDSDDDWNPTTFGISLEETTDKTLVKFSHTDWPELNHHYRFSAFCWAQLLQGLKNYIEKGTVIPFEERS